MYAFGTGDCLPACLISGICGRLTCHLKHTITPLLHYNTMDSYYYYYYVCGWHITFFILLQRKCPPHAIEKDFRGDIARASYQQQNQLNKNKARQCRHIKRRIIRSRLRLQLNTPNTRTQLLIIPGKQTGDMIYKQIEESGRQMTSLAYGELPHASEIGRLKPPKTTTTSACLFISLHG